MILDLGLGLVYSNLDPASIMTGLDQLLVQLEQSFMLLELRQISSESELGHRSSWSRGNRTHRRKHSHGNSEEFMLGCGNDHVSL